MKRSVGIFCCLLFLCALSALSAQSENPVYQFFRDGNYDQARRVAQLQLINDPSNIDARIVMSWVMLVTGQYQNALDVAQEGQELAPDEERFLSVLGEAHYELGNYLDALMFLERYATLAPDGVAIGRVHSIMGDIFIRFGEHHHAIAAFSAAVYYDPSVAFWWQQLGFAHEQVDEKPFAKTAYERALELNPSSEEIQLAIARVSQ